MKSNLINSNQIVKTDKNNDKALSEEKEYVDVKEASRILGLSERTVKEILPSIIDKKKISTDGFKGHDKFVYNVNELLKIKEGRRQQQQLAHLTKQANTLSVNQKEEVIGTAFYNNFSNSNIVEQAKSLSILFNNFSNNLNNMTDEIQSQKEKIKELEEKLVLFEITKADLEKSKETINNLENTIKLVIENKRRDFTLKEIRTTIINSIKYRCYMEQLDYREFTNQVYTTFFNRHNFSYEFKQGFYNSKPHLNFIEDKDLLIEILQITKE